MSKGSGNPLYSTFNFSWCLKTCQNEKLLKRTRMQTNGKKPLYPGIQALKPAFVTI